MSTMPARIWSMDKVLGIGSLVGSQGEHVADALCLHVSDPHSVAAVQLQSQSQIPPINAMWYPGGFS